MYGRKHREQSRAAMSRSKEGRRWIHRGNETRQARRDELGELMLDGWQVGRQPPRVTGEQSLPPEALVDMFLKKG